MSGAIRRTADGLRVHVLPLMVPRTWPDAAGAVFVWACLSVLALVAAA